VSIERAALLAAYRPMLAPLVRRIRRRRAGVEVAAYVVTLMEPTGYLLAVALQGRYGEPDPDAIVRYVLEAERPHAPVLFGVTSRAVLARLLDGLSPRLSEIAAQLRRRGPARLLTPALVAASGAAELVPLDPDPPAPTSTVLNPK
jgi:hypothetical protein